MACKGITFANILKTKTYMKKKCLKICNTSLLLFAPIVLASGILLEYLHGKSFCGIENALWTWLHIIVSSAMTSLVVWHLLLNWQGVNKWHSRFKTHQSAGLKFTTIIYVLTIGSGIIVFPLWLHSGHIGIGGLHGKIGFVSALCILLHILKHRRWYYNTRPKTQ